MATCKVFLIGPHNKARYDQVAEIVKSAFARSQSLGEARFSAMEVLNPAQNPSIGEFPDWNLGQIDTASLVIADVTNSNANVFYELGFAHSIGAHTLYITVGKVRKSSRSKGSIKHYIEHSLIDELAEEGGKLHPGNSFMERLGHFFRNSRLQPQTMLSKYYGDVPPIDSEFTRGLASTYYENLLGRVLNWAGGAEQISGDVKKIPERFLVIMPDTLERGSSSTYRTLEAALGKVGKIYFASNSQARPLELKVALDHDFMFDLPTIAFSIKLSRRFERVKESGHFSEADRDRVSDRMLVKFVEELLYRRRIQNNNLSELDDRLSFVWMSEVVPNWTTRSLLNAVPLPKPERF